MPPKKTDQRSLFMELPGDTCTAPRDGLSPAKTEDMLFLSTLLTRRGPARNFLEVEDANHQRKYIPEPVGMGNSAPVEGCRVKSRISAGTVRSWLRDRFFPFRQILASGKAQGLIIRVNRVELRGASRWKPREPWAFGGKLKWPFIKGEDSLLRDLYKIPFFAWEGRRELKRGELYCPLDGPVKPLKVQMRTSPESWSMLCGREWEILVCPHCLGEIQSKLVRMN